MKRALIQKGWCSEPGTFVSIRPVDDEYEKKTFLGIYVGEIAIGTTPIGDGKKVPLFNPCIWVPDLQEYILGCESW